MKKLLSRIEGKKFKSRKEAKDLKSTRYFTGKECPYGHIADRYTTTGYCVECSFLKSYSVEARKSKNERRRIKRQDPSFAEIERKQRLADYHKKVSSPEGKLEVSKRTHNYWHNIRKLKIKQKMETDENFANIKREKARNRARLRREDPSIREQEKKTGRIYREKNRAKYRYYKAMRRAKILKATPPWLSKEQKKEIRDLYELRQIKSEQDGIEYHVDHIFPLAMYSNLCGLHVPWNLKLLTAKEHRKKTLKENRLKRKNFTTGLIEAVYENKK